MARGHLKSPDNFLLFPFLYSYIYPSVCNSSTQLFNFHFPFHYHLPSISISSRTPTNKQTNNPWVEEDTISTEASHRHITINHHQHQAHIASLASHSSLRTSIQYSDHRQYHLILSNTVLMGRGGYNSPQRAPLLRGRGGYN